MPPYLHPLLSEAGTTEHIVFLAQQTDERGEGKYSQQTIAKVVGTDVAHVQPDPQSLDNTAEAPSGVRASVNGSHSGPSFCFALSVMITFRRG